MRVKNGFVLKNSKLLLYPRHVSCRKPMFFLWNNSFVESSSWESNCSLACQDMRCIICTQKVHFQVHSTQYTVVYHLLVSWTRLIQYTTSDPIYLWSTLIFSFCLWLGLPSGLFCSCLTTIIPYAVLFCSMHATCPTISFSFFGQLYINWWKQSTNCEAVQYAILFILLLLPFHMTK
jgi:hypothetical protein